jgi:hypothetical protein
MTFAHDIYAETNPAFCACALVAFTKTFISINSNGPEVPIVYLSLPVALSGDLSNTFVGTNKNTGLLEWLERNPQVQIGLPNRLNASIRIVEEAIRFGCFARVLRFDQKARLSLGDVEIKTGIIDKLADEPSHVMKRAERLGYWFARAGSTRAAFEIMGLTL